MSDPYPPVHTVYKQIGTYHDWVNSPWPPTGGYFGYTEKLLGENFSVGHPRSRDGKYHAGGAWTMYKRENSLYGPSMDVWRDGVGLAYSGMFQHNQSTLDWLVGFASLGETVASQEAAAWAAGAQAYAALKPDQPDFTAASNLWELKETFQSLYGVVGTKWRQSYKFHTKLMKKGWSKNAADEYVKQYFGWVPMWIDLLNFLKAFHGRKKRFDQLLRDEGKSVHRFRNLSGNGKDGVDTSSSNTGNGGYNVNVLPTLVTQCYKGGASTGANLHGNSWKANDHIRIWCAGRSKYLLPPGPRDAEWNKLIRNRILGWHGGCPPPNQIWQVIPWSWLADYFTGIGHFLDAVSPGVADRVWFEYAYVMRESTRRVDFTSYCTVFTNITHGYSKIEVTSASHESRKTRVGASPFGFGLGSPTLKQMSILGALGYSKLP
nr:MAG: hypothetical protein 1 [Leviviridae sp.]